MHPIVTYKQLFLILVLALSLAVTGREVKAQQTFGNEWINYAQSYYKIKILKSGLYRLDYDYLTSAGLGQVNPQKLQLYRRGQEIAIHVNGQQDGKWDKGDYLEFYGKRNDGESDTDMYRNPGDQIHTYYSLFTDTAAYFLTWSAADGKRMATSNLSASGLTPEPYRMQNRLNVLTEDFAGGTAYGLSALSEMVAGEGFLSGYFGHANPFYRDFAVDSILDMEASGPKPSLDIALTSSYYYDSKYDILVVTPSGSLRQLNPETLFLEPFAYTRHRYELEFSDINPAGKVTIRIRIKDPIPSQPSILRVYYLNVSYPQKNLYSGPQFTFNITADKTGPSFYQVDKAPANPVVYDITDPVHVVRIPAAVAGGQASFVAPGGTGRAHTLFMTDGTKPLVPAAARKTTFRQLDPTAYNYIIVSNKKLATYNPGGGDALINPVQEYAKYRKSVAGGGYDTLIMYVDDIYNQFHYGDKSPNGIRRMMSFLRQSPRPKHLLLLGKGVEFFQNGSQFRKRPSSIPFEDLVPPAGASSDILYTADWKNNSYVPQVPIGRVAVQKGADIMAYLEKVQEHEALPANADWRKNLLHLGGGVTNSEKNTFINYLNTFRRHAKAPLLGASVKSIFRETASAEPVTINVSQELNAGLSLITFFGHSSTTVSDIDIGYVSNPVYGYTNRGKYPMLLINGCFTGNPFSNSNSFGEDWLLTPNKGAIIFMAHSNFGYASLLFTYTNTFYQTAFNDEQFYGKSIGEIQREVIRRLQTPSSREQVHAMLSQVILQGDPALRLVSPEKPDYAFKANALHLQAFNSREVVTAATDSFQIVIPVRNLGKATQDSFFVSVTRNGETLEPRRKYPPVFNQDTIYFTVTAGTGRLAGENIFEVTVDPDNALEEMDETNNKATLVYNFPATGARALFPAEYAIVNTQQVKLVGQATDLLQANRSYYFELDTSAGFNSPWKKSQEVDAGPVPSWTVTLPPNTAPNDSVVYYWRFRLKDQLSSSDTIWGESSFRYIPASPTGWSQGAYPQFTKASGENILLNKNTRQWEFSPISKNLQLRAAGGQLSVSYPPYGILVNSSLNFGGDCQLYSPNLLLAVFNDKTLEAYTMPANIGSTSCGVDPKMFYHFRDLRQEANREYLRRFLEAVPVGFYVAMVSVNSVPFSNFSPALKDAIRSLGSRMIDSVQTGYPFALVGQKGATIGTATEMGYNLNDPLPPVLQSVEINTDITARGTNGAITSTPIGPASEWRTLYHTVRKNGAGNDRYRLQVIGYDLQMKNATVLQDQVQSHQQDLSAINAAEFPYLQLVLQVSDSLDRTAPQLQEWMVTYTGVPEGVVRADLVGVEQYASLAQQAAKGKIEVRYAFQNISEHDFTDSLLARITVEGTAISKELKVAPLKKDEVAYIPYTFATNQLKGNYTLRLTVNPLLNNPMVQPEQYYFNNTLDVPFSYTSNLHPVLDVAFNGRHIMNGDIVSPHPEISITLKDEDQYTFIQDPSLMEVFLQLPGSTEFTPVDLNGEHVQYTPASKGRDFRLVFTPQNLADGVYTLRVQGRDVGNNKSGFEPYTIQFEVVNESSVTHFYPYPNPFSSKTRFVFTLTGSTIPEKMKIQIMTVTGKVVREIMQEELGPLKIGNNISEFAWDGTDEFGDKLANGVYLYRVVMADTDDFKHRYTAGDKAFKKDYGKIYILR